MASFYLDHDVPAAIRLALQAFGRDAITSRDLHTERANDAEQLFTAAHHGRILITHNRRDFELLHHAWRLWSAPITPAGILVIQQGRWSAAEAAEELHDFVGSGQMLTNELYGWSPSRGWVRFH